MFVHKNFEGVEYGEDRAHKNESVRILTDLAYHLFESQDEGVGINYDDLSLILAGNERVDREMVEKLFDFSVTLEGVKSGLAALMGEFTEAKKGQVKQEVLDKLMLLAEEEEKPSYSHYTTPGVLAKKVNEVIEDFTKNGVKITDTDVFASSLEQAVKDSNQGNLE